jgi:antitoxin PrlF
VRAAKAPASIAGFIGCLAQPGPRPPSIEEMNEVIAQGWAGKR